MMNRWVSCLAFGLWIVVASQAAAKTAGFDIEGKYEVLQPPQLTETGDRIEVVDVFWYGCPHCYTFLPSIEAYEHIRPEYVEVRRMPAIFRESWVAHARAYYTAMLLGVINRTHRALFEEIHDHRKPAADKESLGAFFERHGVDRTEFDKTFDSFAVESLVRKSIVMQQRYGLTGTPTVIVNGKYRVTGQLAGSYNNMVAVIRELVERERNQVTRDVNAAPEVEPETPKLQTAEAEQQQAQSDTPTREDTRDVRPLADKDRQSAETNVEPEVQRELASSDPSPQPVLELPSTQATSPPDPTPRSVWQSWHWALIGIVALLLISAGGYIVGRRLRRQHGGIRT